MAAVPPDKPSESVVEPLKAPGDIAKVVDVDLVDDYSFVGSELIGFISNLPNFIGTRHYTEKEDFTLENLAFSVPNVMLGVGAGSLFIKLNPDYTNLGLIAPMFSKYKFSDNTDSTDSGPDLAMSMRVLAPPEEFISLQIPHARVEREGGISASQVGKSVVVVPANEADPDGFSVSSVQDSLVTSQKLEYSAATEKTQLMTKYKYTPPRRDFIERIYTSPSTPGFSNFFSLVESPYDSLLGGKRIEGETTTSEDVQQTVTVTEAQAIEAPAETAVEINIGSFNYSSY
jgi:hypothetical protein